MATRKQRIIGKILALLSVGVCLSFCASGECVVDGSVVGDAYSKLWNADVQRRIDERIERHREADGDFYVSAPDGTEVTVQQISHAFQFGSHIFNFDQLGRDDRNDEYKAVFTNLWNAATVPFYWREMEPSQGAIRYGAGPHDGAAFWNSVGGMSAKDKAQFTEYRRPAPDPILDFCEANGISPHGHVMIYPPFHPAWTTNGVDAAALAGCYERRIRQLGAHYGARIPQWDVVNESVDRSCTMTGPFHDKVCWGRPNMLVPEDYTFRCYKWAEAAFPREVKQGEPFNVVVMREDISKGEQVDEWEFVADGKAILRGKSIGLKRIRVLETPYTAKSCEVKVLKDGGALQGVSFKLYCADPELVHLVLSSTTESGETDTAKWMMGDH